MDRIISENISILYELNKINEKSLDCAKKYCDESNLGEYKCSVKNRFGFFCDLCLEEELLFLHSQGIHTVASCCGHGNKKIASILTVGEDSYNAMINMGYEKNDLVFTGKNESLKLIHNWTPKSKLIYEAEKALEGMKNE